MNEKSKDHSLPQLSCLEPQTLNENHSCLSQGKGEENRRLEPALLNKKRGPQRPPPPKRDKYKRPDNSVLSLSTSSESLLVVPSQPFPSSSPTSTEVFASHSSLCRSPAAFNGKLKSGNPQQLQQASSTENVCQHLEEKTHLRSESILSSKYQYLQKPDMETSRSPSPQFAPQKLTDKPPVAVQDENPARYSFTVLLMLFAQLECINGWLFIFFTKSTSFTFIKHKPSQHVLRRPKTCAKFQLIHKSLSTGLWGFFFSSWLMQLELLVVENNREGFERICYCKSGWNQKIPCQHFPHPSLYMNMNQCRDKADVRREAVSFVTASVLKAHTVRYTAKSRLFSHCFYNETWHSRCSAERSTALSVLRWAEDSAGECQSFCRLDELRIRQTDWN